ncbi:glycoside/pentoside/hexuronide:cation symporter, GPH family [Verrucomicrobium sp. GAS474]|uniref:MFS transporter n=1 Tax=Verrucomicrobium sp. GAS474 TaxID=1882831 RepID=UPI00087D04B3|nr:MFS transporter [Verrucomicrobium sp. GAS474]SDT88728.1 glycoside/pentoside/hexuronide:cation symporter, GPH family [Verrucomicrobium sp. GAS474]
MDPLPASAPSGIPSRDRIPLLQKIMFSAGGTTDYFATGLVTSVLWMPYFNIGLGLSPALLGMALMVLRGWDAFADPVMGNISDNARTRWGRRRPFMVAGAIATSGLSLLLWRLPEGLGEHGKIAYLIVVGMVFYAGFSCWAMPYYSLQLELTPHYDERTRLSAWMALFSKFSGLLGGWTMALLTCSWFADPVTGKADIVHGVRACSGYIAALILVMGLLPALFVKERYYQAETRHQARDPFWKSIGESARCGPLWCLIGISFFLLLGGGAVGTLGQYLNIYYVNGGKLAHASVIGGWISSVTFLTGIVAIPFWTWVSERLDKKVVLAILLGGSMAGHLLNVVCLQPGKPYLQVIPAVFSSMIVSAVWLFIPSMKGDVADYDELRSTRRREGSLNAFFSWFIKAALTGAAGLGGLLIQLSGFSAALPEQPPEVLQRMRLIFLILPLAVWSVTLLFIWYYPLDRKRMAEVRAALERRRGVI